MCHRRVKDIIIRAAILLTCCLSSPAASSTDMEVPEGWHFRKHFFTTDIAPKPIPEDENCGVIPYTRSYLEPIQRHIIPRQAEVTHKFCVTLAKGEYEPFLVCLYGLRDIGKLKLEVTDATSHNAMLANERFEIRHIDHRAVVPDGFRIKDKIYQEIPSLLPLGDTVRLKKSETSAFWITVHALPQDTKGVYQGEIRVLEGRKQLCTLQIEVNLLPFVLPDIPRPWFATLYTPVHPSKVTEKNARLLMQDMVDHGMSSYSPVLISWGKPLSFHANGKPKVDTLIDHLRWAKEEGFTGPTLLNLQKILRAGRPGLDASYQKFDERVDLPNLRKLVPYLEGVRQQYELPEIFYLPIDEPGCFTDKAGVRRLEMALKLLKELQAINVRGATTIADLVDEKHRKLPRWQNVVGWWDRLRPYCPVRIYANGFPQGPNSLDREIHDAKSHASLTMLYENTSTMGIDPRVSRMYFGFYGWRTGVDGITSWTHPTSDRATVSHVWNQDRDRRVERQNYYQSPEWVLPPSTICWEMVREGIDDAKYLYLLQQKYENRENQTAAYHAFIEGLKKALDTTAMNSKKPKCDWSGEQFAGMRAKIVELLLE